MERLFKNGDRVETGAPGTFNYAIGTIQSASDAAYLYKPKRGRFLYVVWDDGRKTWIPKTSLRRVNKTEDK